LAIFQSFNILGFIILLHEVTHDLVFRRSRSRTKKLLGWIYSLPSAISSSQFQRWHLDHHDELGSKTADPKRAHLSPKSNLRWKKALYFTPALFLIYATAASCAAKSYNKSLKLRIMLERILAVSIHIAFAYWLFSHDTGALLRVWVIPLMVFFPPIFLLNRLGQHYSIDPEDPAHWSTRVDGNFIWRLLFVNSNHHIEHHYFPKVPHYNLPQLNLLLRPFFEQNAIENRSYTYLLIGWFIRNCVPHSDWNHS
jgi:fatty acid desaturase